MASTKLEKAQDALARLRAKTKDKLAEKEHTAVALSASFALGVAKTKGKALPPVMGIDGNIVWGAAMVVAADHVGGRGGRALNASGHAIAGIGAYELGQQLGSYIGGPRTGGMHDASIIEQALSR